MAKLRLGCLPLRIETGRYSIPRLEEKDRNCQVCTDNVVEDECHFLLFCNKYEQLRQSWFSDLDIPNDFMTLTIDEQLQIMLNMNPNIKATAKFIECAWDLRNSCLLN